MRRLVCTFVLTLTMLAMTNLAVAASNFTDGQSTAAIVTQPAGDNAVADSYLLARRLNPRLEFAQWYPPTSWICQTPTFWCQMVEPDFVGDSCFCATAYGPVAGYVR